MSVIHASTARPGPTCVAVSHCASDAVKMAVVMDAVCVPTGLATEPSLVPERVKLRGRLLTFPSTTSEDKVVKKASTVKVPLAHVVIVEGEVAVRVNVRMPTLSVISRVVVASTTSVPQERGTELVNV